MNNDNFFNFMVFYELLFPDDEDRTVECDSCGRIIKGSEKVEWINKKGGIFKCPDCGKEIELE